MNDSTDHRDVEGREPGRVSPELALVDADLARRLRRRVPTTQQWKRPPLPVLRHSVGASMLAGTIEPVVR
jgi:hypothetical protein